MLELVALALQDTCSSKNICQKDAVSNPWRLLSLLPSSWHNSQPSDTRQNCVLQAQPWISTAACGKYPINQIKLISYLHIYNRYTKNHKNWKSRDDLPLPNTSTESMDRSCFHHSGKNENIERQQGLPLLVEGRFQLQHQSDWEKDLFTKSYCRSIMGKVCFVAYFSKVTHPFKCQQLRIPASGGGCGATHGRLQDEWVGIVSLTQNEYTSK